MERATPEKKYNPKSKVNNQVPTLFELSLQVVLDNLYALENVGDVPLFILDRILKFCSPQQLRRIEEASQRKDLETDKYWKKHCKRDFSIETKDKESLKKYKVSSWRNLYLAKENENTEKIKKFQQKAHSLYLKEMKEKEVKKIQLITPRKVPSEGPSRIRSPNLNNKANSPKQGKLMQKVREEMKQIKSPLKKEISLPIMRKPSKEPVMKIPHMDSSLFSKSSTSILKGKKVLR